MNREKDFYEDDKPQITEYFNGKRVPNGEYNERPKNRLRQLGYGLFGLLAAVALTYGAVDTFSSEPSEQQTAFNQQTDPTATVTPTETAQPYTYQYPWIRRPLDGIDPTVTPTKPSGYYTDQALYDADMTATAEALEPSTSTPTSTPPPTQLPDNYRLSDPDNPWWVPVGEHPTPTNTIEAGTYLDPNSTNTPEPPETPQQ